MKFLVYFLIAVLGFNGLPSDALSINEEFPIEAQLADFENTISVIDPEVAIKEECENLEVGTISPYWDKITILGESEIDINVKKGNNGLVLELPKGFICYSDRSFIEEIKGTDIIELEVKNIKNHQYLFIQHLPKAKTRIYRDTLNPKKLHIAIAKKENPYPYKVVIDPGHGGFDPGASYNGVHEKNIVLDIALRMEHKLKDLGIDTIYTRRTDKFIDLYERAYISNRTNPDAFISIHNNANKNTSPRGIGTYLYTPRGFQKKERVALATAVQESLIEEFPDWKDWGLIWRNFCVIRETKNPSILIEFGFLSNQKDRELLQKAEIRDRAASAIAKGINKFIHKNDG